MGSIKEVVEEIKANQKLWWLPLIVVLVGTLGFGLGRLSGLQAAKEPLKIIYPNDNSDFVKGEIAKPGDGVPTATVTPPPQGGGQFVGSRISDKYHYPWCSGAKRITEANKVWFNTKEEAERAGYTPAANCPGL